MNKILKTLILSSLSILTSSAIICSPIVAHNSEINSAITQIRTNLSSNKNDLQSYQQNLGLLKSLTQKKVNLKTLKQLSNEIVTDEQLEQFKNDILDKMAASIWTIGNNELWSYETTKNAVLEKCGTFLKNFQMQKEGLNPDEIDEDENNISLYKYLQDQEIAMDIDVFDSYEGQLTINSLINDFTKSIYKTNSSILSPEQKQQLVAEVSSIFDGYIDTAKSFYYSQLQFDVGLLDLENNANFFQKFVKPLSDNKNLTYESYTDSIAQKQLQIVMTEFVEYYKNTLQLNQNGKDFVSCLSDYSSNGYLSLENNVVNTEDLAKLFTFKYNTLQGSILSRPTFNYSVMAGHGDELKDDYGIEQTLPIQDFKALGGAKYNIGELYPGYLAHFRLTNLTDDIDDSECRIFLEIGISDSVRDPHANHILWYSDFKEETGSNSDDKQELSKDFQLSVVNVSEKRYIAKNKFYKNLTAEQPINDYDKEIDEYCTSTTGERPYLNEILDMKATVNDDGTYNISKDSPLFLYGDDLKGIPIPTLPKSFINSDDSSRKDFLTSSVAYKHQYLRFAVTDYDTNTEGEHKTSLCGHWVVMSNSPSSVSTNGDTANYVQEADVYDLPWCNVNSKDQVDIEDIWISYEIDEKLLKTMQDAQDYASVVKNYVENVEPEVLALKQQTLSNGETPIEHAKSQIITNGFKVALDGFIALSLGGAILYCFSVGVINPWKWIIAGLYAIAILLQAAAFVVEVIWVNFLGSSYNKTVDKIIPTVESVKTEVHDHSDDIIYNYGQLTTPRLTYGAKEEAVSSIYNDIGLTPDGSQVQDQKKLNEANDWFEKIKSLIKDELTDDLYTFYANKFVFSKASSEDFQKGKDGYHAMCEVSFTSIICGIAGICINAIAFFNKLISGSSYLISSVTSIIEETNNISLYLNEYASAGEFISHYNPLYKSNQAANDAAFGDGTTQPNKSNALGSAFAIAILTIMALLVEFTDFILSYLSDFEF